MLQKQILQVADLRFRMYELTGAGTGTGRLRRDVRDRTTKLMFSKFAILPYTYCYSFTKEFGGHVPNVADELTTRVP